jgi:hypothetical protein
MRKQLEVKLVSKGDDRLVFVDNRVIGEIRSGWFEQKTTRRHLLRALNSKGIEYDVYQRLLHEEVEGWRLRFTDTAQILSIPLARIPQCGILNPRHSAGYQYHIKLQFFDVEQKELQRTLFG